MICVRLRYVLILLQCSRTLGIGSGLLSVDVCLTGSRACFIARPSVSLLLCFLRRAEKIAAYRLESVRVRHSLDARAIRGLRECWFVELT